MITSLDYGKRKAQIWKFIFTLVLTEESNSFVSGTSEPSKGTCSGRGLSMGAWVGSFSSSIPSKVFPGGGASIWNTYVYNMIAPTCTYIKNKAHNYTGVQIEN